MVKTHNIIPSDTDSNNPWWNGVPTKLLKKTLLVPESPGHLPVYTLTFEIPKKASFSGKAQPHSSIRVDMGDVVKMVIPGHKPKSYSVSALREDEFDVTIKVYPNGRASGYLDRLKIGDTVNSFGMRKGRYRDVPTGGWVCIIAFGVGITEALPVAQAELDKNDAAKVKLLWASRTVADTFWNDAITTLKAENPDKFEMECIFSREHVDGSLKGRIDAEVLRKVFPIPDDAHAHTRFLSVGTKEMMRMTDDMLSEIGFPQPEHALFQKP